MAQEGAGYITKAIEPIEIADGIDTRRAFCARTNDQSEFPGGAQTSGKQLLRLADLPQTIHLHLSFNPMSRMLLKLPIVRWKMRRADPANLPFETAELEGLEVCF